MCARLVKLAQRMTQRMEKWHLKVITVLVEISILSSTFIHQFSPLADEIMSDCEDSRLNSD